MLACELRLSGTDPIVLERLPGINETPKGNGLVGQIVPMLDYRGLLDRLRQEATFAGPVPHFSFGPLQLDFSRLGTSPVHILTVPQRRVEKVLEARLTELGGTVRRGHELTALSPHDDAVTLDVRGPGGDYRLRARYLVGCDGAHSLVRKQAGIGFPGTTSPEISRIGQVRLPTAKLTRRGRAVKVPGIGRLKLMGQARTPRGTYSLAPLTVLDKNATAGVFIVYTSEDDPTADLSAPMTLEELRASARRVLGGDLPMTDPQRLTRLAGNTRQADRYQAGRILLAGDAAHVFGVSLNTGLLDAVNLGWKLAAQVQGRAPALRTAELFLQHRLFRSLATGAVIRRDWLTLHYPPTGITTSSKPCSRSPGCSSPATHAAATLSPCWNAGAARTAAGSPVATGGSRRAPHLERSRPSIGDDRPPAR